MAKKKRNDWDKVVKKSENTSYNYDNRDEQFKQAGERYSVRRFQEEYAKAQQQGNKIITDTANGKRATQKQLTDYDRSVNTLNAFYNDDVFKKYYDDSQRSEMKKGVAAMRDATFRKYYSDYMNTQDFQDSSYEQKQPYIESAVKEKKQNKLEKALDYLSSALSNSAQGQMFQAAPTAANQQAATQASERLASSAAEYKNATADLNAINQYRADLWNEEYTKKNLAAIQNDKELAALVKTAYDAQQNSQKTAHSNAIYAGDNPILIAQSGGSQKLQKEYNEQYASAMKAIKEKGYDADSLLDSYTREQNKISAEQQEQTTKKLAEENPVVSSVAYVGANVLQGAAIPQIIASAVDAKLNGYKPLDTNSAAFAPTRFRETVSQTVSENIQKEIQDKTNSTFWANAGSFAYQTGLSMGDFLTLSVLPEPVSLAIMGTSAGVAATKEAADRGVSADQALLTGVAAGVAEAFFERFSLENLNALKATGKSGIRNYVLDILKQSFTEGSEEFFTDIANALTDQLINGDKSELALQYKELIANGATPEEAARQVAMNFGLQLTESFAGGALSGGLIGMYGGAVGNYRLSSIGKSVSANTEELNSLINVASALPADSNAAKLVKQMNTSTNVTNAKVGELYVNTLNDVTESFNKAETMSELTNEFAAVSESAGDYNGSLLTEFARSYQENAKRIVETEQRAEKKAAKINAKTNANTADTNTAAESDGATTTAKNDSKAETITATAETKKNTFALPVTIDSTGNNAVITSVHSTKGGDVRFTTASGETVSVNDITAKNQHFADIVNDAVLETKDNVALGANGASLYIQKALDANLNSSEYVAFKNYAKQAYLLGVGGANWGAVAKQNAAVISRLGTTTARQFYDAGVADNGALTEIRESNKRSQKTAKQTVQKTGDGTFTNETNDASLDEVFKAVAKKLHINVKYVTDANGNGSFDAATATLTIVQGAKRGDATTLAHEIGEYGRAYNYDAYKQYVDTVINMLMEMDAISTTEDILAYHKTYHKGETNTTIQDAKEELVNDVTARLFFAEGGIEEAVKFVKDSKNISAEEKHNFFDTLKSIINHIVDVISKHVTNKGLRSSEKAVADMSLNDIKALRKQFISVIDGAISNLENGVEVGQSIKQSIQTDENGSYVEIDIDQDIFNGKQPKQYISVITKYMRNKFRGKIFPLGDNTTAYVGSKGINEYSHPARKNIDSDIFEGKLRAGTELDNLLEVSTFIEHTEDDGHHSEAVGGWDYYSTVYKVADKFYEGVIRIENRDNGREFKDITKIREINRNAGQTAEAAADADNLSINNIPQNAEKSNTKKSLDIDEYMAEGNSDIRYSKDVSEETRQFLENQPKETVYRAMQVIDGKLYPPMAAKVKDESGKNNLVTPSELGVWEQAEERPDLIRNGNKFKLDKANGSSIEAAYNPYFHTSRSPLNDQFSSAYKRPNIVIVEGEIPSSELTSGYKAEYAKDSVGEMKWHSGPVSSKLKGEKARRVILSRWFKPVRIVPDTEVASVVANLLEGEDISVPYKVVTPTLKEELEKQGVAIKYSQDVPVEVNSEDEFDRLVNTSMTMEDAKQMIQRAFVLGEISRFEPDYKNGDEWLKGEGVDMVALHIENEYALQEKYLNKIQAYLDGEIFVESILEAYQNGTLTGKEKAKAQRLDTSIETRVNDERFYSPQRIDNAVRLLDLADQKAVGKDKNNILAARAKIILFAHNSGAAELLGLTQTELNQKLRSWSGYNKRAADVSKRINAGVALANRWSGIENCSNLVKYVASRNELAGLVKSVEGASSPYERNYITRTMLALDTHIDWSWLDFKFESHRDVNNGKSGNVNGYFRHREDLIVISHNSGANTVAHEMGHALDYKWGNDLGFKGQFLTEVFSKTERINDPTVRQFFDNFKIFLDDITDSSDIRNEYTIDVKEVFARFVARFVEWTDNTASNNFYRERSFYDDKFTLAQFVEFARLLQEKSMLENTADERIANDNTKFSKDVEDDASVSSLIKENKQLQKSLDYYKMMSKRNTGHKVSRSEIRRIAADLKNSWTSTMTVDEIAEELTALYDHISSGNATWGTIELMGKTLGKELVESAKSELDPETSEVRDYLKSLEISLDDYQEADVRYLYENMRTWINGIRKGVKYRKDGIKLDDVWQEMSSMYPYIFAPDTNSQDQPAALYEAIQGLYDTVDNSYGYDENELAEMIMLDIYDKYYDIPEVITPVDRANKKLMQERTENKNRLEAVKQADKERYEKKIAEVKKHYQEMNSRLREQKNQATLEKLARQKAKYEDKARRTKDTHERARLRASIRKQLNKILNLASKPTKEKHLPNAIVESVRELAEAVTLDGTQYDARLKEKLNNFRDGFEENKKNNQYYIISELYNDYISDKITDLNSRYGNAPLKELPVEALREINDLMRMTAQTINNINRLFNKERNATIDDYVDNIVRELEPMKKDRTFNGSGKAFFFNTLKPVYFFEYVGSDTMTDLYQDVRHGEDVWAVDISEAKDFVDGLRKQSGYNDWDFKNVMTFDTVDGKVELTLGEVLGLYANTLGEHTKKNLLGGGFVYQAEQRKGLKRFGKERNDNSNHRLSIENIAEITGTLTAEQKNYVRKMIKYLSTTMGAKGNEVSRELYGVELFKEQMYYPALVWDKSHHQSSKEFRADKKIKNAGFTNAIVPEATNPLILKNFDDVWANHIDEMSKYHAFALVMENFDRVYNTYSVSADNKYMSTKEALENAHGKMVTAYIDDLLKDINGGVIRDSAGFASALVSKFKKNAVFASASVVVQQPSAVGRALSEISAKYFVGNPVAGFNRNTYNEMKKYCPVAVIKEFGYFDMNMAQSTVDMLNSKSYEGVTEKVKAFVVDGSYRDEAMSFFAAKADEITWTHIWNACKNETIDKHPELVRNGKLTEDGLKKAGERFTEVITKTQVYDSVFSRSGLMRSDNWLNKMATAFMAEPTTSLNMLTNAIVQRKRGKISGEKFARVLGSLVAASILNSLLQSLVTAARHDDKDKDWKEVYLAELLPNFIDNLNPINQIAFVRDIVNIFKGYDVTRSDMSVFEDLYNAWKDLNNDNVSLDKKITGIIGALGIFVDVPARNILRDVYAAKNVVTDFFDDYKFSKQSATEQFKDEMNSALGFDLFTTDKDERYKKLYNYQVKGDTERYNKVYEELTALGLDDKKIAAGVKSAMVDNDIRVAQAALAYNSGDLDAYIRYINDLTGDGFTEKAAKDAITSYNNSLNTAKGYLDSGDEEKYSKKIAELLNSGMDKDTVENAIKGIEAKESTDSDEAKMLYKWTDIYAALDSGQSSAYQQMYQDALDVKVANGKSKAEAQEEIKKNIAGYFKKQYVDDESTRSSIESKLNSTGLFSSEDYARWQKDAVKDAYDNEEMVAAFEGGVDSTRKYVNDRINANAKLGVPQKKVEKDIRSAIAREYKDAYWVGDANTRANILTYMQRSGLYGDRKACQDWINRYWKED